MYSLWLVLGGVAKCMRNMEFKDVDVS
jgi:hypothetical protein